MKAHITVNCLHTADFHWVHGTHRSEFFMHTQRKKGANIRSMHSYLHCCARQLSCSRKKDFAKPAWAG